ncbi:MULTISPECIES: nuclear transport factor 2 family protein [unclassified Streptomyces]|uniref:nuclear transport factor 2 family protein n=1 Tax=unclassified Streptomyces TaxID=2593676 RepID=UPI002E8140E1|nr:nuclear transport factor 2 family protein [Streptomyces sp. NBC_00589]WTI37686.1 nuclear transport factor 2 family protein [Streptomyces sp. NBC_00775]WUB28635.1 nuclear transport factor 2 family protein [Streptomyces sp. NBC_00589]
MTTSDPRAVVIRYVEAVRDGDADVIHDSFSEDATWHYPGDLPISKVWHGRDEIINDFLGSMGPVLVPGTMEIELVSTIAEGDRVVAEWTSKATTVYGGTYDNRCIGIYTIRDGKIASVIEYADTRHVGAALFPGAVAHRPAGTE